MRLIPVFLCLLTAAWSQKAPSTPPADLQAVVETNLGTFRFDLAADKAPKHVAGFVERAKAGYYDGSAFHRVVANDLIQGGDPGLKDPKTPRELWGRGGREITMAAEPSDLKHVRGIVSAVRQYDPDTDGTGFFVCIGPQPALDKMFTPFGRVVEGMDVVEKISQVPADQHTLAKEPVRILKVTIEEKKKR